MSVAGTVQERILERRPLDLAQYKHRQPAETDYDELITAPSLIYDAETRNLAIVYLVLDDDTTEIAAACQRIDFQKSVRSSGLVTTSRIFGNQPRNLPQRDNCTATSLATRQPREHAIIAAYADQIAGYYQAYNPDMYQRHAEATADVLPEWRMQESVFTSGIINRNNPLSYHFDAGNFSHVWSNMLVLKHDVSGGYLSVPEYGVAFALPNNSLLLFDGQDLLHGVTPIGRHSDDAYRFSIVFYSLKKMWKCLPVTDELIRLRRNRTERERRRARGEPSPAAGDARHE